MPAKAPPSSKAFFAPFSAIPFILKRPALLGLSILPITMNLVLFIAMAALADQFISQPMADKVQLDTQWLESILAPLVRFLLTFLLLILSALLAFLLIIPISAPFADLISERIEKEILPEDSPLRAPEQGIIAGALHALKDASQRIIFVLPIILLIFLIGFVPLVGGPIAAVLGFLNSALFLAIDAYSYSMDRRSLSLPGKWRYLRSHRTIWFPLGAGLSLFLLIPCNVIFLPFLSAVAGTRLYCEALIADHAEAPPRLPPEPSS